MIEDQETRSQRLKERIDREVSVLSEVAKPYGLEVVTVRHSDGLMGDPESPAYHPGLGRSRRYALVGPSSEHGEIKVLGWEKRRSGTESELKRHFLTQLERYEGRIREVQQRARVDKQTGGCDSDLIVKHRSLIDKFLEIAERKVAIVDDYGDENWEVLEDEIARCVLKIAKLDGDAGGQKAKGAWTWFTCRLRLPSGEEVTWRKYGNLRRYLESEFREHHERCKAGHAPEAFDELTGLDFEVYIANVLKSLGFENVTRTPPTGDQGADLTAQKGGRRIAIQAKRYKGSVGNAAVQEIVAALKFYKADEGWVITSGTFTQAARILAHANGIRLVDGTELRKFGG